MDSLTWLPDLAYLHCCHLSQRREKEWHLNWLLARFNQSFSNTPFHTWAPLLCIRLYSCEYSSYAIVFLFLYLCMYQLLSFAMPPLCQTQRRPFERWKFMVTGHWIRAADIWSHEWPHTLCLRVGSLRSIVVLLCLGTRCIVVLLCLGIVLLYSRGYPSTLCCIVVLLCLGTAYI